MDFSDRIIGWYQENKRDLPWRDTSDPYKIWISETILQQTRVAQGISYYRRFIQAFPDVESLAKAESDEVMKLWQGLGYYTRARHLHEAARQLILYHGGKLPGSFRELIAIKGIGEYSAAAIASIAFHEPVPLVDGNVFRVISRLYRIGFQQGTAAAKKAVREIAGKILDPERPGQHNQAMMEFGAIQCIPRNPGCPACIFRSTCKAYRSGKVEEYPATGKRSKLKDRFFNYLFIQSGERTIIRKREGTDIWKGLYEFPLIETSAEVTENDLTGSPDWKTLLNGIQPVSITVSEPFKHLLSHQRVHARFFIVILESIPPRLREKYLHIPIQDLGEYPVPRLIERFLEEKL